ncbi:hypothetical protein KC799_08045 [candidate division KSB1 bacterium]|nr:hypothetical protein [candidate division KSB1 bacterium]
MIRVLISVFLVIVFVSCFGSFSTENRFDKSTYAIVFAGPYIEERVLVFSKNKGLILDTILTSNMDGIAYSIFGVRNNNAPDLFTIKINDNIDQIKVPRKFRDYLIVYGGVDTIRLYLSEENFPGM